MAQPSAPSIQNVPTTANIPVEETGVISEIGAEPKNGGEGEKGNPDGKQMEATEGMDEEEKGENPPMTESIADTEMITGPIEEPEKVELAQAAPREQADVQGTTLIEDDNVQSITVKETLSAPVQEGTENRWAWRRKRRVISEESERLLEEEERRLEEEERRLEETEKLREEEEKKRKGKQPMEPKAKRVRLANQGVVLKEPVPTGQGTPQPGALEWGTRLKRKEVKKKSTIHSKKAHIEVDDRLLKRVVSFDDPKKEEECRKRVGRRMAPKSGLRLHQLSLEKMGAEAEFLEYITGIGFEWLLEVDMPTVPLVLAQEFFTSFSFTDTTDLETESISFRLCTREVKISLTEWSVRLGLYSIKQALEGDWFGRDLGQPEKNPAFDQQAAWRTIAREGAPEFKPATALADYIEDPVLRLAQTFLGYSLLGQAQPPDTITQAELYFMWCMKEQRRVHLGYWIARTCNDIATNATRRLSACHFLGALVKHSLVLKITAGPPKPPSCPVPELFDLRFLIKTKVLRRKNTKLFFYNLGLSSLQTDRINEEGAEEEPERQLALTPQVPQEPKAETSALSISWNEEAVRLLQQMVKNSAAQQKLLEQILQVVSRPPSSTSTPPPGRK